MLTYQTDMEVFQKYTVEQTNAETFVRYAYLTAAMAQLGDSTSKITAKFPEILPHPIPICWLKCSILLWDTFETMLKSQSKSYTARQLIVTPYRLAKSAVSRPPIDIEDICGLRTEREQLVSIYNS